MSDIEQAKSEDSWAPQNIKKDHTFQFMPLRDLLKVIDLLKQQHVYNPKCKIQFTNQWHKNMFLRMLKQEEQDQYFREIDSKKYQKNDQLKDKKVRQKSKTKKGCTFAIGSYLKSQILMLAYKKKIQQLQQECHVKIYLFDKDIFIQGQKKVTPDSIIYCQLLDMKRRLHIYVFYQYPQLYQVIISSQLLKRKLQKIGIYVYLRYSRYKHTAFYSFDFQQDQIRAQIQRQMSFHPRIFRLYDTQISYMGNVKIFDLLQKSSKDRVNMIQQKYQSNLQINKKNSCFILHLKHEVFAEQLVKQISHLVSNLIIFSFYLKNPRAFLNKLIRNSKNYPFVNASYYKSKAYCCIDRSKVRNKKDLLVIFSTFLDQLNQQSILRIHLKPNSILHKGSTMPVQILELIDQCKLQVDSYEQIMNSQKFNIIVRPRLFTTPAKKSQKQFQFSQFLLKLLILQEKQRKITEEELNESILNNSLFVQDNTDDSRDVSRRANRVARKDKLSSKKQQSKKEQSKKEQIKNQMGKPISKIGIKKQQKYSSKSQSKQINKQKEIPQKKQQVQKKQNKQIKQTKNQQLAKQKEQQIIQDQDVKVINKSGNISPKKQQKYQQILTPGQGRDCPKFIGSQLEFKFKKPQLLNDDKDVAFQKSKKDKQLQELLSSKETITTKVFKLKVNKKTFNFDQEMEKLLNKQKCYSVQKIIQADNSPVKVLNFKSFSALPSGNTSYIVYLSNDEKYWLPTHLIQKY